MKSHQGLGLAVGIGQRRGGGKLRAAGRFKGDRGAHHRVARGIAQRDAQRERQQRTGRAGLIVALHDRKRHAIIVESANREGTVRGAGSLRIGRVDCHDAALGAQRDEHVPRVGAVGGGHCEIRPAGHRDANRAVRREAHDGEARAAARRHGGRRHDQPGSLGSRMLLGSGVARRPRHVAALEVLLMDSAGDEFVAGGHAVIAARPAESVVPLQDQAADEIRLAGARSARRTIDGPAGEGLRGSGVRAERGEDGGIGTGSARRAGFVTEQSPLSKDAAADQAHRIPG